MEILKFTINEATNITVASSRASRSSIHFGLNKDGSYDYTLFFYNVETFVYRNPSASEQQLKDVMKSFATAELKLEEYNKLKNEIIDINNLLTQ